LKLICKKAKFIVYITADYPELNYRKNRNLLLKVILLLSLKITQLLSNENWILSEFLMKKYKTNRSFLIRLSSIKEKIFLCQKIKYEKITLIFVGRLAKEKNPHIADFGSYKN
jgi:glycosyltransferase involved in cell wall biosynthesis